MQSLERDFQFFVPVDIAKSASLNDDGDWVFEGIASTSNMDLFGDVVYPSSFQKSIEFFKQNGKIFYNHNYAKKMPQDLMEAQTPIGIPVDAELRDEGLYIKGVLNKQHPIAQKIWRENLSNPDTRFNNIGLSIGAKALGQVERKYSDVHKRYVSVLPDLLLYEVSMTATPVNPETKTWAANHSFSQVMKSIIGEEESTDSNINSVEIIEKQPDEVIYDRANDKMVVKSTVTRDDGTTYSIEQIFDLPEDIKKSMPLEEDKNLQEAPEETTEVNPQEDAAPEAAEGGENPFEEATPEGGAPEEGAEGGAPEEEAEGGTPLDAIFGGGEAGAEGGDPMAEGGAPEEGAPQEDASMSLLLDKVDTLVEVMTTIAQDLAADRQQENPGVETSDTPPNTTVNDDILKSIENLKLELSNEYKDNLNTIIKSVVVDSLRDVVADIVKAELGSLKEIQKSVEPTTAEKVVVIKQPGVEIAAIANEDGSRTVLKSLVSGEDIDVDVLKGYIQDYVSVRGGRLDHSTKRAAILLKAEEELGLTQPEFMLNVRKYEKGQL